MAKKNSIENDGALVPVDTYAALATDPSELRDALEDAVGVDGLRAFDLDRLRIPSGASEFWAREDADPQREVVGIILAAQRVRQYWSRSLDDAGGETTPPDCSSIDGRRGEGDPGGDCRACPMSQFVDGRRPRCAERRHVFILESDRLIPTFLNAPTTSAMVLQKALLRILPARPWHYVWRLGLEKVSGGPSGAYSRLTLRQLERLDPDKVARVEQYRAGIGPLFQQVVEDAVAERDDAIEVEQ